MEPIYEKRIASSLGRITVRCSDRGLRQLAFESAPEKKTPRNGSAAHSADPFKANGQNAPGARWAYQAVKELEEYLAGRRTQFTVPLDLDGTAFQKKVWQALCRIPYGETRSYGEVARQVGNPRAARAVGMANHENPAAIVVPCHRVIRGDGRLGGYGGGRRKKSALLRLEQTGSASQRKPA